MEQFLRIHHFRNLRNSEAKCKKKEEEERKKSAYYVCTFVNILNLKCAYFVMLSMATLFKLHYFIIDNASFLCADVSSDHLSNVYCKTVSRMTSPITHIKRKHYLLKDVGNYTSIKTSS